MNPREQIEQSMVTALMEITPANGYDVPKAVWRVTREHVPITQIPDEFRPTLVLLTEEGGHEVIEFAQTVETDLTLAILIYETVPSIEVGASHMNRYAAAVCRCLMRHQYWDYLAEYTEITGVPTHELLTVPDAITTVHARTQYLHEDAL